MTTDARFITTPELLAVRPTPFTGPSFLNGWSDYGGGFIGGSYARANGFGHLQGVIQAGTMYAPAFVLPVGFRPAFGHIYSTVANDALASFEVRANGEVVPRAGSNVWFSIECSFLLA